MSTTNIDWLELCLTSMKNVRVGVFGDFCMDAYWEIDKCRHELSVETGLPVRCVRSHRYSLGGAANVAANLAALKVAEIYAVGMIGDDLYGRGMLRMLNEIGVNTEALHIFQKDWQTTVFGKPFIDGVEQNRIDFGGFNVINEASIATLTDALDGVATTVDVVILNQQVLEGASTPAMIKSINAVIARHPTCTFIVDSRHYSERYEGAALKINAHEAARVAGEERALDEEITADEARAVALRLYERTLKAVFVTRGEEGIIVVDEAGLHEVPTVPVIEPNDPVGAGDTTLAALAAVLGGGGDTLTAARLANIAASVVVRKVQTTGTASPDEIRQASLTCDS